MEKTKLVYVPENESRGTNALFNKTRKPIKSLRVVPETQL
jgi:hypothetical protein